jgi:hypothetical protein
MAKPKQKTLIKVLPPDNITVWTDEPTKELKEINAIEGVDYVNLIGGENPIYIKIDPRYDLKEIAAEIKDLLKAEVPDVFKE